MSDRNIETDSISSKLEATIMNRIVWAAVVVIGMLVFLVIPVLILFAWIGSGMN